MTMLAIESLQKRYGRLPVLRGLTLGVREGEVYGFLGRNGAGKSTTIRIVMGITKADSGKVRLFGEDLSHKSQVGLRQRVGYVAQEQNVYSWMTPRSLSRFLRGLYPTWDQAEFDRLVDRLDLPKKRKVGTFSGGMKVKLALASALAHRPKLLVLDEPTAGLDPVARREFLEIVRGQAEATGCTTFFSTHLIDEVEVAAHRVGIVDDGATRFEGTVRELAARFRRVVQVPHVTPRPLPLGLADEQAFRIVSDEERDGRRQLVVEAREPRRFLELVEDGWELLEMPLEELFIEMVRRAV